MLLLGDGTRKADEEQRDNDNGDEGILVIAVTSLFFVWRVGVDNNNGEIAEIDFVHRGKIALKGGDINMRILVSDSPAKGRKKKRWYENLKLSGLSFFLCMGLDDCLCNDLIMQLCGDMKILFMLHKKLIAFPPDFLSGENIYHLDRLKFIFIMED